MVFHTVFFIIAYLPAALLLYYVIPAKFRAARNTVLLLLSLLFYAWGEPIYVLLLIYSVVCNFLLGRDIDKKLEQNRPRAASKSVVFGLVLNGFILCFFRYFNLLIGSLGALFHTTLNVKDLPIPIGVSIFTLQACAYLLDIWEEKTHAITNPIHFGLFLAFFPKLMAGPIVSAEEMEAQIVSRKDNRISLGSGLSRFIVGLSKKVILADTVAVIWQNINGFAPSELSALTAWIGALSFGFELYFELSGYADMALGLAEMFGFTLPENFAYPFTGKSLSEFWNRFNITVFRWFRDRLFIPMGGNSRNTGLRARSLFLTWALIGLWYGPSWHYLVWGLLTGLFMVLERLIYGRYLQRMPGVVRRIYTIVLVTVLWAMFAKDSVADGFRYMGVMFGGSGKIIDSAAWYYLRTNIILFVVMILGCLPVGKKIKEQYIRTGTDGSVAAVSIGYILLFLLSLACVAAQSAPSFLLF